MCRFQDCGRSKECNKSLLILFAQYTNMAMPMANANAMPRLSQSEVQCKWNANANATVYKGRNIIKAKVHRRQKNKNDR